MQNRKPKVLLIGWDGADWEHINPLLDEGLLPTLNSLIDQGTIGNLATLQPVLSPMLWNSVATCKFADKHGIHGFVEPDKQNGGARPFSSSSRRTKALWNIFSQNDIRSNVINWWASHPAEKINGFVATNLINGINFDPEKGWVVTPGTMHPAEKEKEYGRCKFFPNEMLAEHIVPFIPKAAEIDQEKDPRLMAFAKTFAEMMTTHSIATVAMEYEPWDFMAVYYTGIDHFSHGFMQYHPPKMENLPDKDFEMYKDVIKGAYRFHDMMLERLLQLAGEDTTVILCSDHGFQSGAFRPTGTPREPAGPAVWHRQYGILVMKGEGIKKDERIYGASLIDVGPTILNLYGLPIGDDMDGRPLVEAFEDPREISTIPSWDDVAGESGMHSGDEVMGSKQSEELLKQFVALGYIDDLGDNKEKAAESAEIENKYNLARCLMWQSKNDEALKLLEEIVRRAAWESRFIVQLADCYFRAGYLKQAAAVLESAFDLEKTNVNQVIIIYAQIKIALGELEEGMKYLLLASRRSPRFPSLHVQIGDVFAKRRLWDEAEKSYRKAIKLDPDFARGYQGLAHVFIRKGKDQEAADAALTAVGLLHRLPSAHVSLGVAMARAKDFERAAMAFQTAARFAPRSITAHRWLSKIYDLLGKKSLASRHRQEVMLLNEARNIDKGDQLDRVSQMFPIPEFESEDARVERLIKERPHASDPVKKSGKTFVLVSGLPRSGTSLMMQMLEAGGMEAITDKKRVADEDNPKGYYEWEDIKQIKEHPELLDKEEYNGKVIKTISMLLTHMPKEHDYKVLFMYRPIEEIAASQAKMIDRLGTEGAELDEHDLIRGLRDHRNKTLEWMKTTAKNVEYLEVNYPNLIREPNEVISQIVEFLGSDHLSDPDKMISAIDESLYRNRVVTK